MQINSNKTAVLYTKCNKFHQILVYNLHFSSRPEKWIERREFMIDVNLELNSS